MITYEIAKQYRDKDWSVFPVILSLDEKGKVQKKPAIAWREYQERLPTDEELHKWFDAQKYNGIGLITGKISRVVVVDVDTSAISFDSPLKVKTISGGTHAYYRWTEEICNDARIDDKPVDFRGDGGFVVLPPSSLGDQGYIWISEIDPMYLKSIPEELKQQLKIRKGKTTPVKKISFTQSELPKADEGNRNQTATRVAGILCRRIDKSILPTVGFAAFKEWNQTSCNPPLDEEELTTIWNSITVRDNKNHGEEEKKPIVAPHSLKTIKERRLEERKLEKIAPKTGYPLLDEIIKGFIPGHLYTMTGIENVGKTSVACNFAVRVAFQNKKVLYIALEPENTVIEYIASVFHDKQFNELTEDDLDLDILPIQVLGKEEINSAERLVETIEDLERYDLVIVDHIGYFITDTKNYIQQQSNTIKKLVGIAKKKQTAIMIIAHLRKKAPNQKKNYTPTSDDISGSGAFKQDSTEVMIVTREMMTADPKEVMLAREGMLHVTKTKAGPAGVVPLLFSLRKARITTPDEAEEVVNAEVDLIGKEPPML